MRRTVRGGVAMADFEEWLVKARQALSAQLGEGIEALDKSLVTRLFYSGYAVGLTNKEIIAALLKPIAAQIRPGLARR